MTRIFSLALVVAVGFGLLAVGFGPTVAVAETNESDNPIDNATDAINETTEDQADEQNQTTGTPVDTQVTLQEWTYSDGVFSLTFFHDGDRPKTITLSEATQPGEGVQRYTVREERLLPGETTLTIRTRVQGGESAVGITTSESLANGEGLIISTGKQGANPFAPFGGTSGVLSGVGLSIVMSGSAALWVVWREESGVMRA